MAKKEDKIEKGYGTKCQNGICRYKETGIKYFIPCERRCKYYPKNK